MSLISVWRDKRQSGWDHGAMLNKASCRPAPRHPLIDAREALAAQYATDAHFVPYRIPGLRAGDTQPRINDAARRGELVPRGLEPVLDLLVIDVDAPREIKDAGPEPWSLSQIDRVLLSAVGAGCAWYVTRGGYRLLWTCDGLSVAAHGEQLTSVRGYLATLDVVADRLVDWNRCYRLPFVSRDGEDQRHPADLDRLGPLPVVPSAPGSVFAGIDKPSRAALVVPGTIREGEEPGRKRTLFRLAAKLRDTGADEAELVAALGALNRARCVPPLDADEIERIARSAMRYEPTPERVERLERPRVVVRPGALPELVDLAEGLLDGVDIYQRSGELVAVDRDPDPRKGAQATPGSPHIRGVGHHRLRVILATRGDWRRRKTSGEEVIEVPTDPPRDVVDSLREAGEWRSVRPLIGVTETPTMRADGSVLDVAGYDPATGIVLSPPAGLLFPRLGPCDRADVRRAVYALSEVVADFPFGGPAHRAVALAAMLTAVGRFGIEGPTPLFLLDAHTPGAGKGLLADIVAVLCTGRRAPVLAIRDDTETEKRITAHLCSGKRVVLLDNVSGTLGGPALDAALTADVWSGRVLGQSTLVEVPNRATWIATGNNVAIRGDLARRTLRCYLDVETERPEERRDFAHADLVGYVRAHRGRLVAACLTILRGYVVAGRPPVGVSPMGSFGEWSRSVRSALIWAGLVDPCETMVEIRQGADRDLDAWSTVLSAWWTLHGSRSMTVPDIVEDLGRQVFDSVDDPDTIEARKALKEALVELAGGRTGDLNPRRVGWILARYRSRIVDGRRLMRGAKGKSGRKWEVREISAKKSSTNNETKP